MSFCKDFGKDKVIFATKEDHEKPSTVELPETERAPGLILANGEINWNCPCLGGMATGPCGVEFREAFSCFHYSEAEPKGSDCYDQFATMQECFARYPTVYNKGGQEDDDDESKDATNLLGTQSNVDTVDQMEETNKSSDSNNEKPTEDKSKS
ncbi:mitochondrial intermembrane space import and assembly protein 40 [Contarinia nasturtii]|uniref:mitochondrial intermembrane space import and assembly protein 40 n=1 Tax=Contarinia nasturtii TaxID=265458 RepID=UPI0012D4B067|nr:mitochondrial intermembrane space import and assembly protein 40 [Contarinia nasturtii]